MTSGLAEILRIEGRETENRLHVLPYFWNTTSLAYEVATTGGPGTGTEVKVTNSVAVTGPVTSAQLVAALAAIDFATQATLATRASEATLAFIRTAVETIDNFISGARGLVTEDNSAAIKTACEKVDDFISGARGLVTEDNSAAIAASLASIDTKLSSEATAARQDTGNASLTSIDSKNPALGQAAMSASVPVTLAYDQSSFESRIGRRTQEDETLELGDLGSLALATRSRYERVTLTDRRGRTTKGSSR